MEIEIGNGKLGFVFAVDNNGSANFGPGVKLLNLFCFHIDTTVAHRNTKIIVPISAMKAVAD